MLKRRVMAVSRYTEVQLIQDVYYKIVAGGFKPDHVVAIASGGLTIGRRLMNLLNAPLAVMMAEHWPEGKMAPEVTFARHITYKTGTISGKVLLVDDLTDTGKTLSEGMAYLKGKFKGIEEIRTATIWHKVDSALAPHYFAQEVKADPQLDPDGLVPWIEQPDEVEELFPMDRNYYVPVEDE